ncbi:hypothetical protein K458DRAFT_383013 [Lentithecium fluviatile CBS 122367]|uniref:Uncharacterized protein n=1 Tax=Lentithecium fluviatile CBS 122367 TaxID=1168545 RepID=A0A6G1JI40_9PLEO|nr:hypothetical protein K458DRAFT_383013 [Lentithecium fluviatile CBS 122367]
MRYNLLHSNFVRARPYRLETQQHNPHLHLHRAPLLLDTLRTIHVYWTIVALPEPLRIKSQPLRLKPRFLFSSDQLLTTLQQLLREYLAQIDILHSFFFFFPCNTSAASPTATTSTTTVSLRPSDILHFRIFRSPFRASPAPLLQRRLPLAQILFALATTYTSAASTVPFKAPSDATTLASSASLHPQQRPSVSASSIPSFAASPTSKVPASSASLLSSDTLYTSSFHIVFRRLAYYDESDNLIVSLNLAPILTSASLLT